MARLLDAGAEPDAFVTVRDASGAVVQGTALVAAANHGQLDAVRLMLDHGADPSLVDSDGSTPLMGAAMNGHAGVVRELAAWGADLDAAYLETGATAFHLACRFNQPECVAALVELGCDTAIKTKDGRTGKQIVEQQGHAAVLDVLRAAVAARLRAGVAMDQPAPAPGAVGAGAATVDALWEAGKADDVVEMTRLLDAGAELDALVPARDADGAVLVQVTALVEAASAGQLDAVRLLLDRGADPRLANSNALTRALILAAIKGHVAVVRELAARGADLDAVDPKFGGTAFHLACDRNQPECAAVLVELGCDTAIKERNGRTGKQVAEQQGHAAVLDVLHTAVVARLRAGATMAQPAAAAVAVGSGAATVDALSWVCRTGDVVEMARLLDAGAEPDALFAARDADGDVFQTTALVGAACAGQLDAVRLLLDRGVDPSLATSEGDTALIQAVGNGHAGVVRELAARGVDLDAAHPETGATAFHVACMSNQPECAAALVELGCDTAMKSKYGQTGKQVAEHKGHATLLERLRESTGRRRELEAERAATAQREEVGRLIARQAFGVAAPVLARMMRDSPADPELLAWQAEVAAAQAEADATADANAAALLAELEKEGRGGGSSGLSKSQKKKEKQRRRKEAAAAVAAEAAVVAAAAAAFDDMPEPELQVDLAADVDEDEPPSEAQPATQPAAQPAGTRRKNKQTKKKGARSGPAAGPLDIIEPGEPEQAAPAYEPDLAVTVGLGRIVALYHRSPTP
jgi:ankyrin repeat protein